jgi:hypothetical protein
MNPNIKRLIEDSGFYVAYENKEVTEKELEALIESVIKKCMSVVEYINQEDDEGYFIYNAAEEIAEHFGVRE